MTRYRIPDTTLTQRVGDELVLLNLNDGTYHGLDEIGTRMVELLGQGSALDPVVSSIVDEYETSAEQVQTDLTALVQELKQTGLLEEC
ncbi:MAG: PqqD family protein [Gammaproteobacteria bacterium]|nr:PqqD family protein [Gammaproteobacteria bacterium]